MTILHSESLSHPAFIPVTPILPPTHPLIYHFLYSALTILPAKPSLQLSNLGQVTLLVSLNPLVFIVS